MKKYGEKQLNLVVDMYGCPNRCRHCWLGHMPNRRMEEGADRFIAELFYPWFEKIAYYSWLREPDYCDDYRERWLRDIELSKNTVPLRFELASFYRIVRDKEYIPFLKEVGVRKVQLTFFGTEETQDRYIGRKGAYKEVMKASDLLMENGVVPRWQCFINEENKEEIPQIYALAMKIRADRCPQLEFFVHEGSCEGENRKLYPIRIRKDHIPQELTGVYLDYDSILTERECCEILRSDANHPEYHNREEITLNISNTYDVYYNFTHMTDPWIIGNLKKDNTEELIRRIAEEDTPALNAAETVTWPELVNRFGDDGSEKVFSLGDYKNFLFNRFLDEQK